MADVGIQERIEHDFTNHPPASDEVAQVLDGLTGEFIAMAHKVVALVPPCRERSLALTKLEECSMWSKAGVARNQPS